MRRKIPYTGWDIFLAIIATTVVFDLAFCLIAAIGSGVAITLSIFTGNVHPLADPSLLLATPLMALIPTSLGVGSFIAQYYYREKPYHRYQEGALEGIAMDIAQARRKLTAYARTSIQQGKGAPQRFAVFFKAKIRQFLCLIAEYVGAGILLLAFELDRRERREVNFIGEAAGAMIIGMFSQPKCGRIVDTHEQGEFK